jgi:hypothetical protein
VSTATNAQPAEDLLERLGQVERLLAEQHALLLAQRAELAQQRERYAVFEARPIVPAHLREVTASLEPAQPVSVAYPAAEATPAAARSALHREHARASRRALLKLGGAAAAAGVAATAALVTSEGGQTAHATDGLNLVIGQINTGTAQTSLAIAGSSSASPFFQVDATGSTNSGAIAIKGLSNASSGIGVYGTASGANGGGVVASAPTGYGVYAGSNSGYGVFGISTSGVGVGGESTSTSGVNGSSSTGAGVWGQSNSSTGVNGLSTSGVGVWGQSTSSTGVNGLSSTGAGMWGQSTANVGGVFIGGRAALALGQGGAPGAPSANAHVKGDVYLDSLATVWVCIADGTPGTWVRLLSVPNGTVGGGINYLNTPVRLLDARTSPGSAVVTRGPLAGNETYAFTVAGLGGSGIPANAQGLVANVTVLGPSGAGNLSLFPAPGPGPSVASMTFGTPGLFLANGVNVGIGTAGQIMIQNQSSGITPLVLDAVAFVS